MKQRIRGLCRLRSLLSTAFLLSACHQSTPPQSTSVGETRPPLETVESTMDNAIVDAGVVKAATDAAMEAQIPSPANDAQVSAAPAPLPPVINANEVALPLPPRKAPKRIRKSRVPRRGCVKNENSSEIVSARAATNNFNEAAYQAELKRQGLVPLALASRQELMHSGVSSPNGKRPGVPKDMIAGPTQWSGSAFHPDSWEFVQTKGGHIYQVIRSMQVERSKDAVICGCKESQCPPYGSGCPGCGSTTRTLYGPIPAGAVYKGQLVIPFLGEQMQVRHAKGHCPRRKPCPSPPPSMPR